MFRLILLASGLLLALAPAIPAPEDAKKPEMYFPVQKGAKWVYVEDGEEWTQVVTEVEFKERETLVSVGRVGEDGKVTPREKVAVSDKELIRLEEEGVRCDPQPHLLRLPHEAVERVQVPAGIYRAIRVVSTGQRARVRDLSIPLTKTCWYSQGIGLVKLTLTAKGRSESVSERVLKSFTPGKD